MPQTGPHRAGYRSGLDTSVIGHQHHFFQSTVHWTKYCTLLRFQKMIYALIRPPPVTLE